MFLLLAPLLGLPCGAQTVPAGRFATLHTPNFRIHYPRDAEIFARDVASRIESMRQRVSDEVGWVPDHPTDVVIVDPYGAANGQAIADSRAPRMRLYASPPSADSVIGHQRDWTESLVVHEDVHVIHLSWPSRRPFGRFLQRLTGIGPLASKSPGWLTEGYATLVEGRLTGAGRPNDDGRAALLRMLARAGRFPIYDELNGTGRHRGGEFIYLVGSAFLEWLEREHGREALTDLWRRMSSVRPRSLAAAFAGRFGETPQTAYGRFLAEVMAEAWPSELVDLTTRTRAVEGYFGPPSLSPEGERIVVPVYPRTRPPRLTVFDTDVSDDLLEKRKVARERQQALDPDDVPDREPPYLARPVDRSRLHLARTARHARFVDDETIVFDAWTPDLTGRLRPDLFLWEVAGDFERRVTRRADVKQPDPAPSGDWAVAVRQRWGETQIVEVDLVSGAVTEITAPSLTTQVDGPRVSPDGSALVWLENRGNGYGWVHYDRAKGTRRFHGASLSGPQLRTLTFGPDGELYASVAWQGRLAVHALGPADAPEGPLELSDRPARSLPGGAEAPEFAADGAAWVLTTTPDGSALHRLPEPEATVDVPEPGPILARAADDVDAPRDGGGVAFRRPYGLGHWSWIPLGGFGVSTRGQGQAELALTGGDVMGRYSAQAWVSGSPGGRGVTGASLALGTRTATGRTRLTGFVGEDRRFEVFRAGAAIAHDRDLRFGSALRVTGGIGGFAERVDFGDGGVLRAAGDARLRVAVREPRRAVLGASLSGRAQIGQTGGEPWRAIRGRGSARVGRSFGLEGSYSIGRITGQTVLDQWTHGGAGVSVWPGSPAAAWIVDPAFAALRQRGTHFDRLDIALGSWQFHSFATRTRVGNDLAAGGVTVVGIRAGTTVQSDPFSLIVADGRGTVGVGRTVEDPERGFAWRGGEWVAWATWTWR